MRRRHSRLEFFVLLVILASSISAQQKVPVARVPFVGCPSDGQGHMDAPIGEGVEIPIPESAATHLAYYKTANSVRVLGPRGWYCFGSYGSGGNELFLIPKPDQDGELFSKGWPGFAGPAVVLRENYGGTSGRFEVAEIIARIFPAHMDFVAKILEEGLLSGPFRTGPYPADRLNYKSKELVEYETPADTDGIGTKAFLRKESRPITGAVALVPDPPDSPNSVLLAVRLPAELSVLSSAVVHQFEKDIQHRTPFK